MPRRSVASLALARPEPAALLPRPSKEAPADIRRLFTAILAEVPRDHFKAVDGHLLEQYCQSTLLARQSYAELAKTGPVVDGKASPWVAILEKAHRSSAVLAGKLRLAPAARMSSRTAGRNATPHPSIYDLMPDIDDDDEVPRG